MNRLKIRHLGVVDEAGHVVGALSARDLLRLRAGEAISLGEEIDDAGDAHGLAVAGPSRRGLRKRCWPRDSPAGT